MRATLWRQEIELRHSVRTSYEHHQRRTRLYLRIEHDGASGFGEVAPQPTALHGDPGLEDVLDEVRRFVLPQFVDVVRRERGLPSWSRVARFAGPRRASGFAVALLEMALLDRELEVTGERVEERWVPHFATPRQATVSLLDDGPWPLVEGVARVRAKTAPGPPSHSALERLAALRVPVLLDFNCSATSDTQVLEQVHLVAEVAEVAAVEQPFAVGNVVDLARLAPQLETGLSVDEGVRSTRDVGQLVRYGAATMICVKPARVGGLANARTLIARAHDAGLGAYVGGFFESPYARRVHQALAFNTVDEPSDLDAVAVVLEGYDHEVDSIELAFGLRPSAVMLECATVVLTLDESTI